MRSTLYAAILFTLLLGCSISVVAASGVRDEFKVTEVFLKADDGRPTGPCPVRVVFNGYITANGPGAIKYTFTRSDGATGPVFIMEFKKAGTQAVMTQWTLGDSRVLPRYAGWQAVKVLSPVEIESNHETGSFEINCGGMSDVATNPNQPEKSGQRSSGRQATSSRLFDATATAPIKLEPNQIARLEVENTGDSSLIIWLSFRDSEGKVLSEKRVTLKTHTKEILEYSIHPDDPSRNPKGPHAGDLVRAQLESGKVSQPGSLRPTLRIIDKQSGDTIRSIEPNGFTKAALGPSVVQP